MWTFWVTFKGWLSSSFSMIKKVMGSPMAKQFFLILIEATTGIAEGQATLLWDVIYKLCVKAEEMFPGPGQGAVKYDFVTSEFSKSGVVATVFEFDYVLHNAVADIKARKAKSVSLHA